jgi:hypothetical protein
MAWFVEHWPYLLIAFGGLCAITGSFAAAWRQSEFEAEMRRQTTATINKTEEAIATITGGESYVQLEAFVSNNREAFFVWLESEGKHTVYDVQFKIEDATAAADFVKGELAAGRHPGQDMLRGLDEFKYISKLGNVAPSSIVKNVFEFAFPADKSRYGFTYDIQARNGSVRGELDFVRNTKGLWYLQSHKARKNGVVLKEVTAEVPDVEEQPPSPALPLRQ